MKVWEADGRLIAEVAERIHSAPYESLSLEQLAYVLVEMDRVREETDELTDKYQRRLT